ncbi:MAG TPA: SHOCT domain-containing protein [Nocardioidaceae bacterium]|jgi:putative membrane protein|nr:SHOCT domain-containing protein [Nocardioidaceae bacterium]
MDDWYGPTGRGNGRGLADRDDVWAGMHYGMGWGGWLLMVIVVLLFAALVVAIVLALLRSTGGLRGSGSAGGAGAASTPREAGSAQQVLDERYARGEIEEEEYLRRRSVLRGQ